MTSSYESAQCPRTIGVLGVGHMGAGIARALAAAGFVVATATEGRSERSRTRAAEAGAADLGSVDALVAAADLFLSITPADQAEPLAAAVAQAFRSGGARDRPLHFVDCNSITPSRTRRVAETVKAAGAIFSDGGIIGAPPGEGRAPACLYVSGPHAGALEALATEGLLVKPLDDSETRATEMKILFASLNKGAVALFTNVMAAASKAGLLEAVAAEADARLPGLLDGARAQATELPDKAARWAIEMRDVAAALEDLGAQGAYHEAAADGYERLAAAFAASPEPPSLEATLAAWALGARAS